MRKKNIGLVISTDIGYDPDDMAMLHFLRLTKVIPDVIITSNEIGQNRKLLLDKYLQLTNQNISTFAGFERGCGNNFVFKICNDCKNVDSDFMLSELHKLIINKDLTIIVSSGCLTNVSELIKKYPRDVERILVLAMVSSWKKNFGASEANAKNDVSAVKRVLRKCKRLKIVVSDITINPSLAVDDNHWLIKYLTDSKDKGDRLILDNYKKWFKYKYPVSYLHDVLALSVLFGKWVSFEDKKVIVDKYGVLHENPRGHIISISKSVNYDDFNKYLYDLVFQNTFNNA
ncbi:nucleoside hydrolase [Candidatus Woesebacteria bacterium]|nr:MAG: nucleoside hydrolase [Candidatus Woesebacteria bacterium]